MIAQKTKTKSGKEVFAVKLEPGEKPSFALFDGQGMCIGCGQFTDGVEPDARAYTCDACSGKTVYGLEELVLMGYVSQ